MTDNTLQDDENWQLMNAGQWYLTNSQELAAFRKQIKLQCRQFNQAQGEQRLALQRKLLPNVHSAVIGKHFACDYGLQIVCSGNFTAGDFLTILDGAPVNIGDGTIIGEGVVIASVEHHKSAEKRLQGWQRARAITIGSRVTIGDGVTILPGSQIDDDCVIENGAVIGRR